MAYLLFRIVFHYRLQELSAVMTRMPLANREMLKVLIRHLNKVAAKHEINLMTAANLGVVFGPTLLRPKEETVASIMDIKFCNEVVEILIDNCDTFFPVQSDSSPEISLGASRKSKGKPAHSVESELCCYSDFLSNQSQHKLEHWIIQVLLETFPL